jgi:hypothetical protein
MSTVSVQLSDSLHAAADELAQETGVSLNQFLVLALSEKVSALTGLRHLASRAERGSRTQFEAALREVADVEAEECDRLATS